MASKVFTWRIFSPEDGGFRGVVLGKSNNMLKPGQLFDAYNYISNGGPQKRSGNTVDNNTELIADTGITGVFQFYNGSAYKIFAKCGTHLFDVQSTGNSSYLLTGIVESGDASNQLSNWVITGGGNLNTNAGVLYWKLTNSSTTRTVQVYKNSDGAAENLVASGSRTGDGSVTLVAANSSGISGSVTVAYTGDDTDLANNTLTYPTLTAADEMQFMSWFSRYFGTDGTNVYSGSTGGATALTFLNESGTTISGLTPRGKSILQKGERMWLTRDPVHPTWIWFSRQDYYDRFGTNGGSDAVSWIACDRDDGQAITGFIQHNEKIFVTKRKKSYWVYGDPSDTWPYSGTLQVQPGPKTGAYDQKTIINCPDGYIRWWGPDGVFQYSEETGAVHISDAIDYELNKIDDADKTKACAGFITGMVEYYYVLMLPDGISSYCDGFAFDVRNGEWYPIKNWNISCMFSFIDGSLHAGFYDKGYVARLFNGTTDGATYEDISCYFKTRIETPPGTGYKKYEHCLDRLQAFNIKNGQTFNFYWNAVEGKASGTWSFTFDASGDFLGEFELGDEGIPDDGSLLISEEELTSTISNPSTRTNSAQRFVNIYFEEKETGATPHGFDYLAISSYIIGEVR